MTTALSARGLSRGLATGHRLVRGIATAPAGVPLLLNPAEYRALKKSPTAHVLPLDVSWHMPNSPRDPNEEFATGPRIQGARRWDLDKIADKHPLGLGHMLPTADAFKEAAAKLGITPDTHVVVYDSIGIFAAPRGAYTFKALGHDKVSVLDGGLPRWIEEGGETEVGPPEAPEAPEAAEYSGEGVAVNAPLVRSYEDVAANATRPSTSADVVLDARALGRYTGEAEEPRPGLSSGHMPNSLPLPFTELLTPATEGRPYTTYRPVDELREVLVDGVGGEEVWAEMQGAPGEGRAAVFSCGSGMTAAIGWLAARMVAAAEGRAPPNAAIYDESWTGYASRPESTIVKGPPGK